MVQHSYKINFIESFFHFVLLIDTILFNRFATVIHSIIFLGKSLKQNIKTLAFLKALSLYYKILTSRT